MYRFTTAALCGLALLSLTAAPSLSLADRLCRVDATAKASNGVIPPDPVCATAPATTAITTPRRLNPAIIDTEANCQADHNGVYHELASVVQQCPAPHAQSPTASSTARSAYRLRIHGLPRSLTLVELDLFSEATGELMVAAPSGTAKGLVVARVTGEVEARRACGLGCQEFTPAPDSRTLDAGIPLHLQGNAAGWLFGLPSAMQDRMPLCNGFVVNRKVLSFSHRQSVGRPVLGVTNGTSKALLVRLTTEVSTAVSQVEAGRAEALFQPDGVNLTTTVPGYPAATVRLFDAMDCNEDGTVNVLDAQLAATQSLNPPNDDFCDTNLDGRVDILDVQGIMNAVLNRGC